MRKMLILCGALLALFIFACDSQKPAKKDVDLPLGDDDILFDDEDELPLDADDPAETAPDTEGVEPDDDGEPEGEETPHDDGIEPSDDGIDLTDDGAVEPDGDGEVDDDDQPDQPDSSDSSDSSEGTDVSDSADIIEVDDYVPPDTDSPVGCDDQVMCTEDVLSGGQCSHLPRHDRCPAGELCSAEAGCVKPDDWICRTCQNGVSDCKYATDICTPILGEKFCLLPCATSAECPGGFTCNELYDAGGAYLGTGCSPNNFVCCMNLDGDVAGVGAKCAIKDCDEGSALIYPGATESCNGKDDNCNGTMDDNLGAPPLCSKQDGICQGAQRSCGGTAGWLDCDAAAYTAWNNKYQGTETLCDGVDNDCNGQVDEPFAAELQKVCMVGIGECRSVGFTVCKSSKDGVECNAVEGTPAPQEMCNELDDDCNNIVDDGFDGKGTLCFAGQGACLRAGVYSCSSDGWMIECDAVAGTPAPAELCNGIDDDCNGAVDNGVDAVAPACTKTQGVCAGAVKDCGGAQSWLDCGQTDYIVHSGGLYQDGTETLCDGNDNDCDGSTDESLTNFAPACDNPVGAVSPLIGVCVGARKACGGSSGWQTCGAAQFGASYQATEALCDYLDNDCDGTVDEGFLNGGTGKYDQNTACGNCQTNCTTIYAKPNAYGWCDASGTPECKMACSNTSIHFDLNGVPADGCEFVLDTAAIYVSESDETAFDTAGCGFGPTTTGGGRYPCKSITYALQRAVDTGRTKLLVADGTYEEKITLVNGKSLLGGYRPDTWSRHLSTTMTIVRGNDSTFRVHKITMNATGITAATLIEGFVIYGQSNPDYADGSGGYGYNSYAIYVSGSNNQLTIRNNVLYGATGGPGKDRSAAAAGSTGGNGGGRTDNPSLYDARQAGNTASYDECNTAFNADFNNGGASSCGATGGRGGGTFCTPDGGYQTSARNGAAGAGTSPGTGGERGYDGTVDYVGYPDPYGDYDCVIPSGHMDGYNGTNGGNGGNGGGGTGCSGSTGAVSSGHWRGTDGGNGNTGAVGGGGGGGGSGGGGERVDGPYDNVLGGHGGGGGAGGCGGSGGTGGAAGGGSFVIFVTASVTTAPTIQDNLIYLGGGGRGGVGGNGGGGGSGGVGGAGGYAGIAVPLNCGNAGGTGGNGGNGGSGGGGGGGCGGTAVGIGYSGVAPTLSGNTFSGGAGGAGGAGGQSIGNAGTAGTTGSVANTRAY